MGNSSIISNSPLNMLSEPMGLTRILEDGTIGRKAIISHFVVMKEPSVSNSLFPYSFLPNPLMDEMVII